ncbi:MAG: sugar phosphate isomerase/epimerase [Planctomycetes bacterium]|nr:sugar phosphate isomerase/epimerase [Planctomycetota bacterium]
MYYSGIADEAAKDIESQVRAHKELGWSFIELRNIGGTNLTDLSDAEFEKVTEILDANALRVSCFASQLANWARPIDTDFEKDLAELRRAIPRMQRLGTSFIRCMSYPNQKPPLEDREWKRRVVERIKTLARMAEDGGITLVHENCDGWGGQSAGHTMELLAEVGSDHLKLVYDTGNPIPHHQDGWEYYQGVRDAIVYVHIKDYVTEEPPGGGPPAERACFPGEGIGYVREIISDLFARGYDGGFSIEPHLTSVVHLQQEASDPQVAFKTYIEYGRRLEALVREIRPA